MPSMSVRTRLLGLALAGSLASPIATAGEAPPPSAEATACERLSGRWFGIRDTLARHGVEVTLIAQGDPSANLAGGVRRGAAVRWPLQAALDLDAERLFGWTGGRFHAGVQSLDGRNATELLVGDAQGFNNVDAERFRQVSELWLEQRVRGDRLRFKVGKADANAEFARVEQAGHFLNSSAGYSPTIQGFPTYPDPAMGVSLFGTPASWLSLGAGVYDGATHEGCHGRTGNRGLGLGTFLGAPSALFLVGEAGSRFTLGGRRGRLSVGSWKHTGAFEGFDGATRRGASGWYGVFEQRLAREPADPGQGVDVFVQLGTSDPWISEIQRHLSVGLSATGAVPGRDQDVLGLMVTSVDLSASYPGVLGARRESAIELHYGFKPRPWLAVKPDLQYILNPGARGAPNAVVGTLRVMVSF
jgi:porin